MEDRYLVVGDIPGNRNLIKEFHDFDDAVSFVLLHDALGTCWIRCPDLRWYNPKDDRWR